MKPDYPLSDLDRAIITACEAHAGQVDRGGKPYILHPLRVMMAMDDDASRIVAVLHDVLEDSQKFSVTNLQAMFGIDVAITLDCLTKRPGEVYDDYLTRVESDPLAVKVKIADLRDNTNMTRLARANSADWERHGKYMMALERLMG